MHLEAWQNFIYPLQFLHMTFSEIEEETDVNSRMQYTKPELIGTSTDRSLLIFCAEVLEYDESLMRLLYPPGLFDFRFLDSLGGVRLLGEPLRSISRIRLSKVKY